MRVKGGGEAKSMKIISQEPRITQKREIEAEGDGSEDGGEGPHQGQTWAEELTCVERLQEAMRHG